MAARNIGIVSGALVGAVRYRGPGRTAGLAAALLPAPDVIPTGTNGVAVWPRDGAPSPMIADRGEIIGHTREKGRYGDSATAAGPVPGPILR
jgi:hypothetical protein